MATYNNCNIQYGNNNTQDITGVIDVLREQLAVKDRQIEQLLQIIKGK